MYLLWAATVGRWSKGQIKLCLQYSKGLLNQKKDLKILYVLYFICLLIIICTLNAKCFKKFMPEMLLLGEKLGVKWPIWPNNRGLV